MFSLDQKQHNMTAYKCTCALGRRPSLSNSSTIRVTTLADAGAFEMDSFLFLESRKPFRCRTIRQKLVMFVRHSQLLQKERVDHVHTGSPTLALLQTAWPVGQAPLRGSVMALAAAFPKPKDLHRWPPWSRWNLCEFDWIGRLELLAQLQINSRQLVSLARDFWWHILRVASFVISTQCRAPGGGVSFSSHSKSDRYKGSISQSSSLMIMGRPTDAASK